MPQDKDVAVGAIGGLPSGVPSGAVPSGAVYAGGMPAGSAISKKPCYLVAMDGLTPDTERYFIAMEKPEHMPNFIQVKGIWCEETDETIVGNFAEIVGGADKSTILDMMFPASKIHYIRSLVFNAAKPKTVFR